MKNALYEVIGVHTTYVKTYLRANNIHEALQIAHKEEGDYEWETFDGDGVEIIEISKVEKGE